MSGFIDYCKEYWQYMIALVVVIVAAFFVFKKARKSYRAYYKRYRAEEAEIKRLTALKEKFSDASAEDIAAADDDELLEGVALTYQLALQKKEDMEAEFSKYQIERQYIYALDVFSQSESASAFFRENGRELTEIIVPALEFIGLTAEASNAERLRIMFDEKDETTSIDRKTIESVDAFFSSGEEKTSIRRASAERIKAEPERFILKVDGQGKAEEHTG